MSFRAERDRAHVAVRIEKRANFEVVAPGEIENPNAPARPANGNPIAGRIESHRGNRPLTLLQEPQLGSLLCIPQNGGAVL